MNNVVQLFAESGTTFRFDNDEETTAADLAQQGRRVAAWLLGQGFERGDRLALRLPNSADYLRLLVACAAGGFIAVSVNTRYSEAEVADLVARSGATRVQLDDDPLGWRACEPIKPDGAGDDPFVVFTTSGTTSKPKLVLHRQRSIVDHANDAAAGFGLSHHDVVLAAMPFGGTFGLASLSAGLAGSCRVVVTNFDAAATGSLIAAERVTCVNGSDDMFYRLLELGADLSSIRLGGYARFNTSLVGIVQRAAAAGATLTGLYGMSEVQALFSLRNPAGESAERARPGGTLVSSGAEYRIVDGELQLRGPSMFAGYLAEGGATIDDELTGSHFDDGWFRTGDLAEPDGSRGFEYIARIGDVLRLGGFLVSPAEVEAALLHLAGVREAQVVAVDRPGGARPVAFVIAPEGLDEQEAIRHCRRRLARYKVPVRVIVIDEFPTTTSANGTKIQKNKLRAMAAAELD